MSPTVCPDTSWNDSHELSISSLSGDSSFLRHEKRREKKRGDEQESKRRLGKRARDDKIEGMRGGGGSHMLRA
jgi:hypothetical protein